MKARKVAQATRALGWGFALGGAIARLVLVVAGQPMGRADQILWLALVIGWIAVGYVNSATIANQRKTIRLLTGRQQQRDRAWLS